MNSQISRLAATALAETGYLEKATEAMLDDKTANAGGANYTKYARDLAENTGISPNPFSQGQAWCDIFVDWCFAKAFGVGEARRLLCGFSAYTPTSAGYFKSAGRWRDTPEKGDVIFFKNAVRICHTGIVYKTDGEYVCTVEGNTSGAEGIVPNGGGVHMKRYARDNAGIAGYGRPDYVTEDDEMTYEDFTAFMDRYLAERATLPPGGWSEAERVWAEELGIIRGDETGEKRWKSYITREEYAIAEYRQANRADRK